MMMSPSPLAIVVAGLAAFAEGLPIRKSDVSSSSAAFVHPSRPHSAFTSPTTKYLESLHMVQTPSKSKRSPPSTLTVAELEAQSEELRAEIKVLREEALRRIEKLNEQLQADKDDDFEIIDYRRDSAERATSGVKVSGGEDLLPAPAPIVISKTKGDVVTKKKVPPKGIANLLDETRWKVNLSIGREPGTWMPKEWGKSGKRLNISFTAEFTPSQLYDRDDFLRGGYTNAKILHVIDNEIKLGPSISEGERRYKVKDGGWQVTRGDGPMGTDLLRFYVEVDEEIAHGDTDVSVPKGRIYSSCGYFPFMEDEKADGRASRKEAFVNELKKIEEKIIDLSKEKGELNSFDIGGNIRIRREIMKLQREAELVNRGLNFSLVQEPDRRLLRFSKDGDVGLTKEGGVCCQVNKGISIEYHILGRFGIKSAED